MQPIDNIDEKKNYDCLYLFFWFEDGIRVSQGVGP